MTDMRFVSYLLIRILTNLQNQIIWFAGCLIMAAKTDNFFKRYQTSYVLYNCHDKVLISLKIESFSET